MNNSNLRYMVGIAGISMLIHATNADAILAEHRYSSNAVNYCQAFTPGPSNTIRNRVIGSENVGTAPVAVACSMMTQSNGDLLAKDPHRLHVFFTNTGTANVTVTCTMLTGYYGEAGGYLVNKSTNVAPEGHSSVMWTQADNPMPGATTLGNDQIGINCTLPPSAVIADMYMFWNEDNGIL